MSSKDVSDLSAFFSCSGGATRSPRLAFVDNGGGEAVIRGGSGRHPARRVSVGRGGGVIFLGAEFS